MATSYGRSPGGYVWAILEPAAGIALLTAIFSIGFRSPPLGVSFAMFYATGMLPFTLFTDITGKLGQSMNYSKQLLAYPRVTFLDTILARFGLNLMTQILVSYLVIGSILLAFDTRVIMDGPVIARAYGLAGLRVGYLFGPADLCVHYHKVRDHFGVNVMAQQAAQAALADQKWLEQVSVQFEAARKHIAAVAAANGLVPLPSATNFVTIDCGRDGDYAMRVLKELNAREVFIRKPGAPGIDRCIRVSCGLPHELDYFEATLPEALKAAE